MNVTKRDGSMEPLVKRKLARCVERACEGIADVSAAVVIDEAYAQIFDGIKTTDLHRSAVLAAASRITGEPNYSYVAARLLMHNLYREAFGKSVDGRTFYRDYALAFQTNIKLLVDIGRFNPKMLHQFDLTRLAAALEPDRDLLLKYAGVHTIYDRYINHVDGRRLETPQAFFMRVAMGLCVNEDKPTDRAIAIYELISTLRYSPATPTLLNSGKTKAQMSSCYGLTMEDSIDGIYGTLHKAARLSKYGGGLGIDITPLRGPNAYIKGTNGRGNGLINWAKQYNDMVHSVNQGGSRKGAGCLYLEPWHLDYLDFLELRKATGDERRRCHDIDTASWIPDEFMRRMLAGDSWYFFSPDDCPDLHETYGEQFSDRYAHYIQEAESGRLKNYQKMPARDLWKKMLRALKETGHPWNTFKDPSNYRYVNKHSGVVHSSQLCCVAGDQRVVTNKGLLTAKELFEDGDRSLVAGRDGIKDASAMALTIKNSPLVCVVTEEGYEHKVTPDHPLWAVDRGWVEAQNLTSGDRVEIQRTFGLFGPVHEPDLALVCGLLAGDGTYGATGVCIDLWPKDLHLIEEVEAAINRILLASDDLYPCSGRSSQKPAFVHAASVRKARLTSTPLARILEAYGVSRDTKNKVPDFVWQGDSETVGAYLRGIFVTDGTYQAIPKKMTVASLSSVSREFLKEIQILLMNCGVKCRIRKMRESGCRDMPDGRGGSAEYWCQEMHRLLITSINSGRNLETISGAAATRKHAAYLQNLAASEGYPERMYAVVSSVNSIPNEDVYCLMVDSEDRAWTCNGLITKNTEIICHNLPTRYTDGEVTRPGEVFVCNLSSINVGAYVIDSEIDFVSLAQDITVIVRGLDNVIDENFYPIPEAELSNARYRFLGLGVMGWADLLHKLMLPFDSEEAIELADRLQEYISYCAIEASIYLAKERGTYPAYEGSEWSKGVLPIDSYKQFMQDHRPTDKMNYASWMNWESVRKDLAKYGIRNSLLQAPAPTSTISTILGCSEGIGPVVRVIDLYQTISGNLLIFNEEFVKTLKARGLWNPQLVTALQKSEGDLSQLDLPVDVKAVFKTAYQIDQRALLRAAARRQKWIDQAQSLNIYYKGNSMKELSDIYVEAWELGLKTTYYLHGEAASSISKMTIVTNEASLTPAEAEADDDQLPPSSCSLHGPCESCQ